MPYACKFIINVKVTVKFVSKRKKHTINREGNARIIIFQSVCRLGSPVTKRVTRYLNESAPFIAAATENYCRYVVLYS